jgi:hypothetical protein
MRDFLYNKSDVLIAILIILIAAFVIYTRVGIIMDYPSKMAGGEGNSYLPDIQDVLSDGTDGDKSQTLAGTRPDDVVTVDVTPAVEEPLPAAEDTDTWTPTAPAEVAPAEVPQDIVSPAPVDYIITVAAGDVGSKIADKLLAAGAITDKAGFLAEVTAQGADTKLKQGTFTIPAGTPPAEIVKILVG